MKQSVKQQHIYHLRTRRTRSKISGTAKRPRLSVYRSLQHMHAQLIDDQNAKTLIAAHDHEVKGMKPKKDMTKNLTTAFELGKLIAERAKKLNITQAVFDRRGYKYHGRVQAVAKGARDGGLTF